VPSVNINKKTSDIALKIASKSPCSIDYGKAAFYKQVELNLAAAYAHTSAVMVQNLMEGEAKEGIAAFLEKRAPVWGGEVPSHSGSSSSRPSKL